MCVCVARCFTVQSRLWCLYSKLLLSSKGCPQPPLTYLVSRSVDRCRYIFFFTLSPCSLLCLRRVGQAFLFLSFSFTYFSPFEKNPTWLARCRSGTEGAWNLRPLLSSWLLGRSPSEHYMETVEPETPGVSWRTSRLPGRPKDAAATRRGEESSGHTLERRCARK